MTTKGKFQDLLAEYVSNYKTWGEYEKAVKEDALQAVAPSVVLANVGWLIDYLPFEGAPHFATRKKLLRHKKDTFASLWVSLDAGLPYEHIDSILTLFNQRIRNGVAVAKHTALVQELINAVWQKPKPQFELKPKKSQATTILEFIRDQEDNGATDKEIEAGTGLLHEAVGPRRGGLVEKGLVEYSGRTRRTPSGQQAKVWVIATGEPKTAPKKLPAAALPAAAVEIPKPISSGPRPSKSTLNLREVLFTLLTVVALKEVPDVPLRDLIQTHADPWLQEYLGTLLKRVIPKSRVDSQLQDMALGIEFMLDDWGRQIRRLRRYEIVEITLPVMSGHEWDELVLACARFHVDPPKHSLDPIDLIAASRELLRKRLENHPDKFPLEDPTFLKLKEGVFKELGVAFERLQKWNERLEEGKLEEGKKHDPDVDADLSGVSQAHSEAPDPDP